MNLFTPQEKELILKCAMRLKKLYIYRGMDRTPIESLKLISNDIMGIVKDYEIKERGYQGKAQRLELINHLVEKQLKNSFMFYTSLRMASLLVVREGLNRSVSALRQIDLPLIAADKSFSASKHWDGEIKRWRFKNNS